MSEAAKDFAQARWPLWIACLCALSVVAALVAQPSWHFAMVYTIATAWTAWNIHAYATGKRFQVAPGLHAAADDSPKHRRIMLGISLCMQLGFTALMLSRLLPAAS